jgi:hypothetical protein
MAKKFLGFTPEQQFTLLSKLGYQGPKDSKSMQQFMESNPAASAKMGAYTQKALERLNPQPEFAEGGTVTQPVTPPTPEQLALQAQQKELQTEQRKDVVDAFKDPTKLVTQATPVQMNVENDQLIQENVGKQEAPNVVTPQTVLETAQATAPTKTETNTVEAKTVTPETEQVLQGVEAAKAEPSKKATVAGQLEGLMSQFEGGATPPWAAGAMRQAMSTMQARGLGASSMAGQAVVQAAMESAIGIASQDAATQAQFEMKNLDNEQQTLIFKTQARLSSLLSDQAQENAARQFNASSKNQTDQFFAGLQESVSRFNADQINAIRQFNAGQTNAVEQFNAEMDAQRDKFNAENSLVIAQANAQWRQTVATTNTAAQHEANMQNAKAANDMTTLAMDAFWQRERDLMTFAYQASENSLDRQVQLMLGNQNAGIAYAQMKAEERAGLGAVIGSIARSIFG